MKKQRRVLTLKCFYCGKKITLSITFKEGFAYQIIRVPCAHCGHAFGVSESRVVKGA